MSRLRNSVCAAFIAGTCVLAPAATAQGPATTQGPQGQTSAVAAIPEIDRTFLRVAATSSATEIDAGKLAMSSSQDDDVKAFAQKMIEDHTRLSGELKAALPAGLKAPEDSPDRAVLESLQRLKGKQFDEAYIAKVGLQGHREAIAAFEREADGGQVPQIRKAAAKALPTIQHHYQMAQELARKKGVSR
jgi:putative membrane protein